MHDSLSPGTVLDERFRIERSISTGGWGEVYRGIDLLTQRPVAIKRTFPIDPDEHREIDAAYAFKRFLEEVKVLRQLDYPGIPKCLSSFTMADNRHCLVMEFIEGVDLERQVQDHLKLAGGLLPAATAVDYVVQACKILEYLHELTPHPIIHRDVKPSNLILRHLDNRIYLVDFGFARPIGGSIGTKTMVGTIGYAPIEQCQGNPTPQSDLYALGATLHYLLTGKQPTPFDIQPLDRSRPELPESLVRAVATATRNEKSQRYNSVYNFRRELERLQGDLDNATGPPVARPEVPFATSPETEEVPAVPIPAESTGPSHQDKSALEAHRQSKHELVAVPRGIRLNFEPVEVKSETARTEKPDNQIASETPKPPVSRPRPKALRLPLSGRQKFWQGLLFAVLLAGTALVYRSGEAQRQLRLASGALVGWNARAAQGLQNQHDAAGNSLRLANPEEPSLFNLWPTEPSGLLVVRPAQTRPPRKIYITLTALESATLWLYVGLQDEEASHIYRLVLLSRGREKPAELDCNIYQEGLHNIGLNSLAPPTGGGGFLLPSNGDEMVHGRGLRLDVQAPNLERLGLVLQTGTSAVWARFGMEP